MTSIIISKLWTKCKSVKS